LINFQEKMLTPFRGLTLAVIRYRLDKEAKELQKIYSTRHVTRDARRDIFVAADFDGKTVSQLGITPTSEEFTVLIFDSHGRLMERRHDVPTEAVLQAITSEVQ